MVSDARKKMLEKIRAMMNTEGRTEAEIMAFLTKARELMATYEIDEKEIGELDREEVKFHRTVKDDPYDIKKGLSVPVGHFTRCRPYNNTLSKGYGITFIGLESDVIFAKWLLETLQSFVMRALREFQKQNAQSGKANSNFTSASFVHGCTARIAEKLALLTPVNWNVNANAAMAGHKAGNSATFNRPVGQGGAKLIGK